MLWAALLLAVLGPGAAALSLEPVVWHTANRRFLAAGGYVLYPQIGDRLDLVCPGGLGGSGLGAGGYEYYKLYLVGGAQARSCQVPPTPTLLLTCDRPQREVRFTIKFQEFSPNLWGHEFRRLQDYYIITTSDGTPEGLENRQGGACLTRAMRVTLRVGQRPGSPPAPEVTGSANQTSPAPGPGPPTSQRHVILGGAGGGAAALLALLGVGGVLWWRHRPRRPPKTPRGGARPPNCPLRDLPPPPAPIPPGYYKV